MPWCGAQFKGNRIWAEVDEGGTWKVDGGRVAIRYNPLAGTKIYRAGAKGVALEEGAPIEALPDGAAPDDDRPAGESQKKGYGKAGTRTKKQAAMAAGAAAKLLDELPADTIICFTDGACRGNPGPAGAGAVAKLPDGRVGEAARALGRATNNVGELTAIGMALDLLDAQNVDRGSAIALFTDSSYAIGVLTKGWKAKANQALIADLKAQISQWPALHIHWVAGHVGTEGNERADELANAGVAGETFSTWT